MAAPSFLLAAVLGVKTYDQVPYWGNGSISGTVKLLFTPVVRRVVLLHRETKLKVRETMSAGDGSYSFPNVSIGPAFQVFTDDNQPGGYNTAVADWIFAS